MNMGAINLLHIPVAAFETITIAFFFKRFLGLRYAARRLYKGAYTAYFLANIIISVFLPDMLALLSVAGCFVISFALYGSSRTQRGCCAGILTAFFFVSESSTLMMSSFLLQYSVEEIATSIPAYYAGAFLAKVVTLVLAFIVSGVRKTKNHTVQSSHNMLLLLITYLCVGLSYVNIIEVGQSGEPASVFSMLSELAIVILAVLGFFIFEEFQKHAEHEAYIAVVERQLANDEARFLQIESQNDEIKGLRHDLLNHMVSMRSMAADEQYKELREYLDEYTPAIAGATAEPFTGAPGVDALLHEKLTAVKNESINVEITVGQLSNINISPVHLNIILGNALDNAIEACCKLLDVKSRFIAIAIEHGGRFLYIRIRNSSLPVDIISGGMPVSSKADRFFHGLGLAIVKRIVERYDGVMRCEYENGEFTLFISILTDNTNGATPS